MFFRFFFCFWYQYIKKHFGLLSINLMLFQAKKFEKHFEKQVIIQKQSSTKYYGNQKFFKHKKIFGLREFFDIVIKHENTIILNFLFLQDNFFYLKNILEVLKQINKKYQNSMSKFYV